MKLTFNFAQTHLVIKSNAVTALSVDDVGLGGRKTTREGNPAGFDRGVVEPVHHHDRIALEIDVVVPVRWSNVAATALQLPITTVYCWRVNPVRLTKSLLLEKTANIR